MWKHKNIYSAKNKHYAKWGDFWILPVLMESLSSQMEQKQT